MDARKAMGWALFAGLLAMAVPVGLAVYLAREQALDAEFAQVSAYAHDVVHRSDATADQVDAAFREILAHGGGVACSPQELAVMRRLDLSSSYIQALGRVEGDTLVCSSLGASAGKMALGPLSRITPRGVGIRLDAHLGLAPGTEFIVLQRDGLAAVIHKSLPVDASTGDDQWRWRPMCAVRPALAAVRGDIDSAWLARAHDGAEVRFISGDHLVAVVPSSRYLTGAIAAVHRAYFEKRSVDLRCC